MIYEGDCREVVPRRIKADSVDTILTDPPYGLHFMGKAWDHGVPGPEFWECFLKVAKPGAMLLAFGGTRTFHRLACAIEEAGWQLRDCMMWLYGQGFPKSHDISKAIDKAAGKEGSYGEPKSDAHAGWIQRGKMRGAGGHEGLQRPWMDDPQQVEKNARLYKPSSSEAALWTGYGTALKPAWEPIIVAMKPVEGTFAANALKHGVAGINVDGGRIDSGGTHGSAASAGQGSGRTSRVYGQAHSVVSPPHPSGRWPSNVLLQHDERCVRVGVQAAQGDGHWPGRRGSGGVSTTGHTGQEELCERVETGEREFWACVPGCPVRMLDEQSAARGVHGAGHARVGSADPKDSIGWFKTRKVDTGTMHRFGDTGTASRFFYCAKASKRERNQGMPEGERNTHPTVKPLSICRYLARLTKTPTGGIVLDPFCGSGSILVGSILEGRGVIGIDSDPEACRIARHRISHAKQATP